MTKFGVYSPEGYRYGEWHIDLREAEFEILSYREWVRDNVGNPESPLKRWGEEMVILTQEEAFKRFGVPSWEV